MGLGLCTGGIGGWRVRVGRPNLSSVRDRRSLPEALYTRPCTVAEARALGVSVKTMRRASLLAPFAGVRRASDAPATLAERCPSAMTFLPDGAVFSHVTALRLIGVEVP